MVSDKLIAWYHSNKRDLPWRDTVDPYFIWLSEVILQQTRVAQGLSYYLKFVDAFPTVTALANATEDEVLKLWQGLGYYSRARNLHHAAKQIVNEFGAVFPNDYQKVRGLKGIGDYTAAAITSFAFNLPYAVLDGNVYRFLSRFYGITIPINSAPAKKVFASVAQEILNTKAPALHNQAIMEFGALHCTPVNPHCAVCPLQTDCVAFRNKSVNCLPVKEKKIKIQSRYFYYFIIIDRKQTYIQQRIDSDIWKGLFQFPLLETDEALDENELLNNGFFSELIMNDSYEVKSVSTVIKHILTHRHIHTQFIVVNVNAEYESDSLKKYTKVELIDLNKYAWPRVIDRYLQNQNAIELE